MPKSDEENLMADKPPIILPVIPAGTPLAPRYRIGSSDHRYWTGQHWSENEQDGLLYANSNDAYIEVQRLLMLQYIDRKHKRFRAPVDLDLWCDDEVPRDQLIRWLVRVSKLFLCCDQFGLGSQPDALGNISIQWNEIEEVQDE
jgi:hypothetical protein